MRDRITFYKGEYTIEIYFPYIRKRLGKNGVKYDATEIGFFADTIIFYKRPRDGWSWKRSFAVKIFGFGIGIAQQHCDNPNRKGLEVDEVLEDNND